MTDLNRELWQALQDREYTLLNVRHEYQPGGSSYYRVMHPELKGHFTVIDRYDYFEKLGRCDCRFMVTSDYEFEERKRSEGVIPCYVQHHIFAADPEECLEKLNKWVGRILTEEGWLIREYREPVRYIHPMSLCDFTLASGVEVWKPTVEEEESDRTDKTVT